MKIGLVLAGGGGLGAFQIGVFAAIEELGIKQYISAVSGTSVGALNTALFLTQDANKSKEVWRSINPDLLLGKEELNCKYSYYNEYNSQTLNTGDYFKHTLLDNISLCTRTGIIRLIEEYAPFEKIQSSSINGYACAYNISKSDVDYFHLNSIKNKEEFVNVLLASSAIPVVYNSIIIKGNPYLDGGLKDNIPTSPILLKEKINKIIVIIFKDKDRQFFIPNSTKRIVVSPDKDIDATVNGVLDFDPQNAEYRMEIGYQSGIKILKNWKERLEI